MGVSDITIINGALRKLGVQRIDSRDDDSEQGRVSKDTYDALRDAVLTDAPWDFATERQELSASDTAPLFGFAFSYPLPESPKCLKPREIVNLNRRMWRVEGRAILTDHEAPVQLIFTALITEEGKFTSQFVEAFQARLAMEWAEALTKQNTVVQNMAALYKGKIEAARTIEAGQTGLHEDTDQGTWVTSRCN